MTKRFHIIILSFQFLKNKANIIIIMRPFLKCWAMKKLLWNTKKHCALHYGTTKGSSIGPSPENYLATLKKYSHGPCHFAIIFNVKSRRDLPWFILLRIERRLILTCKLTVIEQKPENAHLPAFSIFNTSSTITPQIWFIPSFPSG